MRKRVKSRTHYAAMRLSQAILMRFGLELNRAGALEQLERQLQETKAQPDETTGQLRETRGHLREAKAQFRETKEQLKETKRQLRQARRRLIEGYWQPDNLRKPGLSPRTVVDVGVCDGTPMLYEAFPEAFQVLVEPLKENEPHLQSILQRYRGEYFLTAVGAREENVTIKVESSGQLNKSSIHSRTDEFKSNPVEEREIPVTTLDALLERHNFAPPFGLKVDTEGFEYQVIQGARNFLRATQFVIAEVNVAKIYEDSYSFADFIGLMDENGFALYDILHTGRKRSFPWELNFVDAMFTRADHARTEE